MTKKLIPCASCQQITYCPVHITDILEDKSVVTFNLCTKCGSHFMEHGKFPDVAESELIKTVDLEKIKSPEQLLDFIFGKDTVLGPMVKPPCPECELTVEQFDEHGKFNCAHCYEHFHEAIEHLVFPYHGAKEHVGKRPKNWKMPIDPEEELKILKLKKTRALEHEKYEEAAQLRREIEQLQSALNQKKS